MTRTAVLGSPAAPHLRSRTLRALAAAGLATGDSVTVETLGPWLVSAPHRTDGVVSAPHRTDGVGSAPHRGDGVWLLQEGAWPARAHVAFPGPSGTGRPLCALGAVLPAPLGGDGEHGGWADALLSTGGDFDARVGQGAPLPPLASVYLDGVLASALGERLAREPDLPGALGAVLRECRARTVRFAPLDVHLDGGLRVAQVVTSLQQGGAERVALDLAAALPRLGVRSLVASLGPPTRASFPIPPGAVELSWDRRRDPEAAWTSLGQTLRAFGADVAHAHLLDGPRLARLSALGIPVLLTVHNVREGWPVGLDALRREDAVLLVACSRAVEDDLRAAQLPIPTRTVWNGIDFDAFRRTSRREAAGRAWRTRLGVGPDDLVLVAVANPRPQKRLPLLPGVLRATQAALSRPVRLLVAGDGHRPGDHAILTEVEREAARLGLQGHVHLLGSIDDLPSLLACADVMVSASAFEGLSLAHVEGLAMGLPLVATAVGGTPELAPGNPAVTLVPRDAGPDVFAAAVAAASRHPPTGGRGAAGVHFTLGRMAEGYRRLYRRAAARRPRGRGLMLVANNFSTGGAQSSARRLLLGLQALGDPVRAAVLQEQAAYPTPGTQALREAGVPVLALPHPGLAEPAVAAALLLDAIERDPPAAVLFWNALAEHKVLLADGLLDVPVFDISPGEMYFESLERFFERPRGGLAYRGPRDYGARLAGVIVKYRGEQARAASTLGAPVHVIPNGVAVNGARPPRAAAGGPLVIGTLARLDPRKRVGDLLAALRQAAGRLPPHVLRIAGGIERGCGDYARELAREAEGLPVEWVGEVGDPRPFLEGLDLFALIAEPAGCPNASLEAMALGLPVVATAVGGMSEQIDDGVTGRLVPPADPGALASALADLAGDGDRRARLSAAGHARVAERFSLDRMVAGYRRVCLGEGPAPVEGTYAPPPP